RSSMMPGRNTPKVPLYVLPIVVVGWLAACEDSPASTAGPMDAGNEGGALIESPAPDAAAPPIRCSDAELAATDLTDAGADAGTLEIKFNTAADPIQYTNHCATVRVGSSVSFSGSFAQHPLEPAGGDTPNAIPRTSSNPPNGTLEVVMSSPGIFGYECGFHP